MSVKAVPPDTAWMFAAPGFMWVLTASMTNMATHLCVDMLQLQATRDTSLRHPWVKPSVYNCLTCLFKDPTRLGLHLRWVLAKGLAGLQETTL